jgi:hypothetical protein
MWSNHVERMHSKIHALNLPTHPPPPSGLTKCLICRRILPIGRGIKNHFRIAHIEGGWFEKPFSCPECVHGRMLSRSMGWRHGTTMWNGSTGVSRRSLATSYRKTLEENEGKGKSRPRWSRNTSVALNVEAAVLPRRRPRWLTRTTAKHQHWWMKRWAPPAD